MTKKKTLSSSKELESVLANQLIHFKRGERLPSIRELAAMTGMSVGAVSKALNSLEESGAVKIGRRGRLGSVLISLTPGELWDQIEGVPLVIAMSLPMHRRFEGLATGLRKSLDKAGISAYMIFIRGSRTRLKALRDSRCHVAVLSGLAADELCTQEEETVLRLPPRSWVSDYRVFYCPIPTGIQRPLRVVVDPDSYDHKRITELEFADQEVVFRSSPFVQFSRLLKDGDVDALVWSTDQEEDYFGTEIQQRPLSDRVLELVGEKPISAAFVARAGSSAVSAILNSTIKASEIMNIQNKVVTGEMIPEY